MSDKITCLIVDDEPMALNLVENYVVKTPFLQLLKKCNNAIDALDFLNEEHVDLIFLDIQMPDLTGLELVKLLPKSTRIIFTTAFDQYALEGLKAEAIDYLLKPFDYNEFLIAVNKAREWFSITKKAKQERTNQLEFIFVKSGYKQLKIELDSILYIEGLKDYIKIWLKNETQPILTLMSLKTMEEELPSEKFMRVHRSFIVALKNVKIVDRNQIIINKQRITVSDHYKPQFMAYLAKNSLQ